MTEFNAKEQARLDLYLDVFSRAPQTPTRVDSRVRSFFATAESEPSDFQAWLCEHRAQTQLAKMSSEKQAAAFRQYIAPVRDRLAAMGESAGVLVLFGDVYESSRRLALSKTRQAEDGGLSVLFNLNVLRHWRFVPEVETKDRAYWRKSNSLVFRGAMTNAFERRDSDGRSSSPRFRFFKYFTERASASARKRCDIGFTNLDNFGKPEWAARLRAAGLEADIATIRQQLRHRFLLSLEGNDVASGLKWQLASRSVVIMPRPRVVSWFCETLLEPWRHYVPVDDDFDDLEEVLDWCAAHGARCREISAEGRAHVAGFLDAAREELISQTVFETYLRHARFTAPAEFRPEMRARNLERL